METLFKNEYTRDRSLVKEVYRYFYFKRKIYIFVYALLGADFLLALYLAIFQKQNVYGLLIGTPILMLLPSILYFVQVKTVIARDLETHGKAVSVALSVTDEFIESKASTGSVYKLDYSSIRVVLQTKTLILLRSRANLVYIFKKDSFTVGRAEDLLLFLKSKGVRVRGKIRA